MDSTCRFVVIAAALFCAAFDGSRVTVAAPPNDACSLLAQAQVSAVLGVPVGPGKTILQNSTAMCGWEVSGETDMNRKRVVLSIYTQMGSLTPTQRFNNTKTPVTGITKEPVSGVGDDALFVTTAGFGTGLIFRKGDAAFDLRVYGFPMGELKAREKALALDVLAKL